MVSHQVFTFYNIFKFEISSSSSSSIYIISILVFENAGIGKRGEQSQEKWVGNSRGDEEARNY